MARLLGAASFALALPVAAQHTPRPDTTRRACTPEHAAMGHCTMPEAAHGMNHGARHSSGHGGMAATVPSAPMTRDGSGTAWNPDASPMEAVHGTLGGWTTMLHGAVTPRIMAQDVFGSGTRGATRVGAPNWAMGMAHRAVGGVHLTLRGMVSLDPLTEGTRGYPLLFQTGEAVNGQPLVDEQHPHDLFGELSATAAVPLGETGSVFAYLAYPGEPALGPTAFMHRPSARTLADAPLGHHWQDATHIVFGVATLGAAFGPAKVEASLFTGREPDEHRYGFDRARFDSYSARIAYAPGPNWTLQASTGFLRSPEVLHPDLDVVRTTASVQHAVPTAAGAWSSALVWGYNAARENGKATDEHTGHSVLLESDLARGAMAYFGRAEWVQKDADELGVTVPGGHAHAAVTALTLGAARTVGRVGPVKAMVGAAATGYLVPSDLRAAYGRAPLSGQVFLRLSLDAPMAAMNRGGMEAGAMDHATMGQ